MEAALANSEQQQRDEFAWFPSLAARTVILAASGPSAKTTNIRRAISRGAYVVVVNETWRLAPWADMLYFCDARWAIKNHGVPGFKQMKVSQDRVSAELYKDVKRVYCVKGENKLIFENKGFICWAGNSGMQALNLVAQFNPARILLVGYDMTIEKGLHWHGSHKHGLPNPKEPHIDRWRRLMNLSAPILAERGIEVVNCSLDSAVTAYPKMTIEEALP